MSWQNLTNEQLEALPTHRLLNVFKLVRPKYYREQETGDGTGEQEARYLFIKGLLDKRDHVGEDKVTNMTHDPKLMESPSDTDRWYRYNPKPAEPRVGSIKNPEDAIGLQVYKTSGKDFKSKNKYNTISGVTTNPHTNRVAFTFEEDGSIVDAHICNIRSS